MALFFNFSGVSFLLQNSLIAQTSLRLITLINWSHSSSLLNSPVNSHRVSSVWPSDCGSVSCTTNITFWRGLSSSCCKSFSTSEGAKRLRESLPWEIILILFGLPSNFAGPDLLFSLRSLEGVPVSCLSLLRFSTCQLVWTLFTLPIFSSMVLEVLLTELSKAEPKLFRKSFGASVSSLNLRVLFFYKHLHVIFPFINWITRFHC